MLTKQLCDFHENWLNKADSYQANILSNHFDKFSTLYVLFNSLYMQAMNELVIAGHSIPDKFKDNIAATDYVVQYLGSSYFLDNLLDDDTSRTNLNIICNIIGEEQFHIILSWGNHQREKDLELLSSLSSESKTKKAKAILTLFYHVRCNMFHGHKDYIDRQRDLLIPTNYLLRKTIEITFNKLNS